MKKIHPFWKSLKKSRLNFHNKNLQPHRLIFQIWDWSCQKYTKRHFLIVLLILSAKIQISLFCKELSSLCSQNCKLKLLQLFSNTVWCDNATESGIKTDCTSSSIGNKILCKRQHFLGHLPTALFPVPVILLLGPDDQRDYLLTACLKMKD